MFTIVKRGLVILYAVAILLPISIIILATFKSTQELFQGPFSLPAAFSFEKYANILTDQSFGLYFMNSVIVTFLSVTITLLFASLTAFALSQINSWVSRGLFVFFIGGMMIPAQTIMLPLYDLVSSLNLTNSLLGLIVVNVASSFPLAVLILTVFTKTIPTSLFEAAKIDGATSLQIYGRIFLPLSVTSLASAGIFLSVIYWNDLLNPLLFITEDAKKTLPLMLIDFQGEYLTNYPMLFAGVILSSIPMVIVYIFLQRYFIAGMTAGSVKS